MAPLERETTAVEADRLNRAAVELQAQGMYNAALKAFQDATTLFAKLRDLRSEARCMNGAGAVYKDLGRHAEARQWLERALPLRIEVGDLRGELLTRLTLGPVYQSLGMNQQSVQTLEKALALAERVADIGLKGQVFFNLGSVASKSGKFSEALDWFRQSLQVAIETSNSVEGNKCLNSLGINCAALSRYDEALGYYDAARTLSERQGNQLATAAALENLAGLYRELGESGRAIPLIEEALRILTKEDAIHLISTAATLYALLLIDESNFDGAASHLELALKTARLNGDQTAEANALQHLGEVQRRLGRLDDAANLLEESVRLCRACGIDEGGALSGLCVVEAERGRWDKAGELAEQAIEIARANGNERELAIRLFNLAIVHDERGNKAKAFELLEASVSRFDALRHRVTGDGWRTSLFDSFSVQNAYYVYVSRLLREYCTGTDDAAGARAFLVSERRHARALLDIVGKRGAEDGVAESELHDVLPWSLPEIQQGLLECDTLLLEYSLHEGQSYLFAVMKGSFEVFVLPDGAEIQRKLAALRDLPRTASPQQFASVSHELYKMLLGPVASFLPGRRLLIVPDAALHALPFQMLVTEPLSHAQQEHPQHRSETVSELARISWPRFGRSACDKKWGNVSFLGRQTIITYAPSASIAAVLRRGSGVSATTPLAFIGFAPLDSGTARVRGYYFGALPQTRLELEKIGAMFRSNSILLFGEAATKAAVISRNLEGFRYIHFATHGFFSALQPEESALVLHPGERGDCLLSAATIMKLRLRADVVGLSACQSAQGRMRYGEGVIGLARAFLYAGARSVCASLWEVADAATAELMTAYYRNLVERGMESAVALQAAQLELMDSSKYGSPYYWAPFILVGG